ncbi:PQQ-binding-like beta-propeller repeat protein [candidate division KSB1 bacterium]|nr:PQQ-binding-like beta-propeller repeat protein [candidate division KSB1 bacterium]
MKKMIAIAILILISAAVSPAQIEIILDNDTPQFMTTGDWFLKTSGDAVNGTARYKARGKGAYYALWATPIHWDGAYDIEMNVINANYADSVFCTIHTADRDTTVVISQRYTSGWKMLGSFTLKDSCWIKVSDKAAGLGSMVLADAVRLIGNMDTYPMSGQIEFSDNNDRITAMVELYPFASEEPLLCQVMPPGQTEFLFPQVVDGWYRLRCTAYGYETAVVDSIQVSGSSVLDIRLTMNPSPGLRLTLSGTLLLSDEKPDIFARIDVYPQEGSLVVGFDSAGHNQQYTIANLLPGHYRLRFFRDGYLPDSTTFADVSLTTTDKMLDSLLLYRYFKFAWITDTHIGAGTDGALQRDVGRINLLQDELAFVIVTGDLTEKGLDSEYNLYNNLTNQCKMPVYSIAGNHDTKWSPSGLQSFKTKIGPMNVSFTHEGFRFIGMSNGIPMRGGCGFFDPADIAWLEAELAQIPSETTPIIYFTHLPLDSENTPNYWRVLDLLKKHRTIWAMVGHGHSNRSYNFEGIAGAMGRDAYKSPPGFNIVTVSEKEINVTTCTSDDGAMHLWNTTEVSSGAQPTISVTGLNGFDITGTQTIQIEVSEPVTQGKWSEGTGALGQANLNGSGTSWWCDLPSEQLENGYHTLLVGFRTASGKMISATRHFFVSNGYPTALWKYDCGATVITKPACDEGGVYVGTSDGRIIGLNLDDGKAKWPAVQASGAVFSSPLVHRNVVYAGSSDGQLYAVDASSGALLWTFTAQGAILSPPVAYDSLLYFAGGNRFYGLGLKSHQPVWQSNTAGLVECKPFIRDDKIIFGCWDGYVRALDLYDGTLKWRYRRTSNFYYAPGACWPVASDDKVFITDPERYMMCLDANTGKLIWSSKSPEFWESIGIAQDLSRVYVRSLDGRLYAFETNATTQKLTWQANVIYGWDSTPSMPIECEGLVYSGGKKGFVSAVVAKSGTIYWKYWVGQSHVTTVTPVERNRVLATSLDGVVILIEGDPSTAVTEPLQSHKIPKTSILYAPYPNPFNSDVQIKYDLNRMQSVRVDIYNLLGKKVFTRQEKAAPAGSHCYCWNGKNLLGKDVPSGVYYIHVVGDEFAASAKAVLVR